MATPTDPPAATVAVGPLRSCQPASIGWMWPGVLPPFTVDVFSDQGGSNELLASIPDVTATNVVWPQVALAGGWHLTVRVSATSVTNATQSIVSGLQTVLPCPPAEVCSCMVRPVPGGGTSSSSSTSSTSSTSSSPTSTLTSTTPTSSLPTSTSTSSQSWTSTFSTESPPPVGQPSDSTMTVTQTPSGGLQSQGPAASMSSDNTGLIVGTTVGGIAFIGIVATLLFFVFRWNTKRDRRRKIQDEFDLGGQGMYDPGYHRDASGDMDEVDHFTPYPFIAPMSYGTNAWDVDHGWNNGRFEDPRATGNAGVPTLPSNGSFPLFPSPSLPYPVASEMSSLPYPVASEMSSLPYPASTTLPPTRAATRDTSFPPQPESMRRTATTTALAAAAGRENKAEAERRRTRSFHQARPSDSVLRPGPPVQAEDGGFVADGGEIPPVYRHEWEAQRQRLNHGAVL